VAKGKGEVVVITGGAFTGSVNIPLIVFSDESVTVAEKETEVTPVGGIPDRKPAAVSDSQVGKPVADQVYPPLPPDAVKLSE
jgi:hypothetical protein